MHYEVSELERNAAKLPHEIFLVNLITNHILIFVALLGLAGSYPWVMLITPTVSLILLIYLVLRARASLRKDSWFVAGHWQLCAQRSRWFIAILLVLGLALLALLASVGGDIDKLRPGHYAMGGVVMLPTLLSVLVLIIMESDAIHKAKTGQMPRALIEKYPPPAELKAIPSE